MVNIFTHTNTVTVTIGSWPLLNKYTDFTECIFAMKLMIYKNTLKYEILCQMHIFKQLYKYITNFLSQIDYLGVNKKKI